MPLNNLPNTVTNIPDKPDLDTSFSYFYLSDLSESSDNKYSKQRLCTKNNIKKRRSKNNLNEPIKSAQRLQPSYWQLNTNQSSLCSNWTSTHYSAVFISYPSWIHLKIYYHYFQKYLYYLWTIHPQEGYNYHIIIKRPHGTFFIYI